MPRVEIHITCRQAGNNKFCSHDSTASPLFISPPFICAVLLSSVAGNGFRMTMYLGEGANKAKDTKDHKGRTELKERRQICTLDKLCPNIDLITEQTLSPFLES